MTQNNALKNRCGKDSWAVTPATRSAFRVVQIFIVTLFVGWTVPTGAVYADEPGTDPESKQHVQLIPDGTRGQALAQRLCVNCHRVSGDTNNTASDRVPSFHEIANRPKQTAQRIRQAILNPHFSMPEISLTTGEIDDIIAYLDDLRTDAAGPELLPNKEQPAELDYPEPS